MFVICNTRYTDNSTQSGEGKSKVQKPRILKRENVKVDSNEKNAQHALNNEHIRLFSFTTFISITILHVCMQKQKEEKVLSHSSFVCACEHIRQESTKTCRMISGEKRRM